MGDADVARGIVLGFQGNDIEEALEELQDNVTALQLNLQELEERTLNQIQERMRDHSRAYYAFRCFVIAINFILIPVLMAVSLSCILKQLIDPEAQDALEGIIRILWMLAASLGASLYLGSIWALYNLPVPERSADEEPSEGLALADDFDFFEMLLRRPPAVELPDEAEEADDEAEELQVEGHVEEPQGEAEERQGEAEEPQNEVEETEDEAGWILESETEEDQTDSDETADLLRNQEHVQNDMTLQPERPITMNSSATTEEKDDTANKDDNTAKIAFFQVDTEPVTLE